MNKEAFPHVGETMYHQVMENGLNVFVFPCLLYTSPSPRD